MALDTARFPFAATPLDQALHLICAQMQLTKTQRQQVEDHYKAVSDYLAREGGPLDGFGLDIYPQGSLRIGTTVKPLGQDEFDLDLVCHLRERLPDWDENPNSLLQLLMDDLKANGRYSHMVKPMNRCIRLEYAGDFHMDVLPGCQDEMRCDTCIEVPDSDAKEWSPSNPRGYAKWFEESAVEIPSIMEARADMYKAAEVEPLPEDTPYTVEPLKRTVQLLKRNRDIFFSSLKTPPTPSVIITTLAAQQYAGTPSVAAAIVKVLEGIKIQAALDETEQPEGRLVVLNPMNEDEDFSEKWDDRNRYNSFKAWVQHLRDRMLEVIAKAEQQDVAAVEEDLALLFGESMVRPAINKLRENHPEFFTQKNPAGLPGIKTAAAPVAAPFMFMHLAQHRERPQDCWPMDLSPARRVTVKAKAVSDRNIRGFRKGKPFHYHGNGLLLPKHAELFFEAKTNVDPPFEIKWRVVNTGKDAAQEDGGLRGKFEDGQGPEGLKKEERTLYHGSHWIDAFVIKDGVCVARSEKFIVNIK